LLFVFAVVVAACSSDDEDTTTTAAEATTTTSGDGATSESVTIGFAISSFDNDFFVSLKDGAEQGAAAAGATVTISDAGGDAATQASQVEDFITQGVDLIMVNPVDSDAIVPSVEAANAAGIPVVAVDRGASGGDIASFVASDNVLGGTMAGEYLFEQMGDSGEVLELQGIIGTSAAQDRGEGFQIALDSASGITRVAQQTANFARDEGLTVTENLLQANPGATGLFGHNDDMALGAVEAAAAAGSDLIIVGFDAAPDALQAIADGTMAGTIAQQPVLMGELAVETALQVIAGETVPAAIGVPVALVTPDNVNEFLE
jgi:ribose transport system substrate-binding protein